MAIGAIEFGGTKTICALGNKEGKIIEQITIPTEGPEVTLSKVVNFFANKKIEKMGIGSFGPIQVNKKYKSYGTILETPKTEWRYISLLKRLRKSLPSSLPIILDTDVNAAAYGEMKWGAARGLDSCVYFTIGTGIGAGAVVNEKVVHGLLHPEAGHMYIKRHLNDDFMGCCPYHGDCLEGLASGTALEKRWGKNGKKLENEFAWDIEAYYLAQAAINATYTYAPEKIIFGGGVMNHLGLIDKVRENFHNLLNGYIQKDFINVENYISLPGLEGISGLKGALALAIDKCD